jgi:hypothetical protein
VSWSVVAFGYSQANAFATVAAEVHWRCLFRFRVGRVTSRNGGVQAGSLMPVVQGIIVIPSTNGSFHV